MFDAVVLSFVQLFDMSPIAIDKIMWYMGWFFCVVLGSVTIPLCDIAEFGTFINTSDYRSVDVFVFSRLIVVNLTACTVFRWVKFRLCRCCCTLSLVCYRRSMGHPIDGYCVRYAIFLTDDGVLL